MSEAPNERGSKPVKMPGAKPFRAPAKKATVKRAATVKSKPTILEILDEMGKLDWNYDAMKRV